MRIGVDTRHLTCGFGTGGARVLANMLRACQKISSRITVIPFNAFAGQPWQSTQVGKAAAAVLADGVFKNLGLSSWTRTHNIDGVLYALPPISFTCKRVPQISYVLDVPLPHESTSLASSIYNNIYIKQTCLRADMILTISQDAANRIQELYHVPSDRIRVMHLSMDYDFLKQCEATPGDRFTKGKYILGIVSRLEWRKNPGGYLETYYRWPRELRQRIPMILVGAVNRIEDLAPFCTPDMISELKPHVICMGRVSDDSLTGLIKHAGALLFPSRYEGFGLPVLEAAACGIPSVISNIAVFKELFSEVADLFDPDDYDGMADKLKTHIETEALGENKVHASQEWLDTFSFDSYAQRLVNLLEEVCG
jgi:glycosyltransferase involved in cell wall biosynthesis